ncbi:peptidase S10 [Sphingomonas sp. RP10(2022)]|uniref:Peptidase S10 n=1 Tax=Sphingomonas liriopis TaxID=2949094 RepID=A0A9X2HQY6_9SPHN|nr:peptidase S10 [Sphingomonas liriopis]MCP3733829.1 peptidase S10 [Sphingomonas liriopis]
MSLADVPPPRRFVTQHVATIGGRKIAFTATAEESYVTNIEGEPTGRFFTFSYVKTGARDPNRPVLFLFNGGPGSASCWLQMGAMGPWRAFLDHSVNPSNVPPFGYSENPDSPLDVADLVFIDPVGTGFSHAAGAAEDSDFAGVDADADSVARFIEGWLQRNGRFTSPKFVLGESYGGFRAAMMPRALLGGIRYVGVMRGITLDGVIIVGAPLSLGANSGAAPATDAGIGGGALIPGMAITADYHRGGASAPDVATRYGEVSDYVGGPYADALRRLKDGALPQSVEAEVADRLALYTGVPAKTWIDRHLALSPPEYSALALAGSGLKVGLYDSRYTLPASHDGGDFVADDPAMAQYVPGIVAGFQQMIHDELKVDMPIPYEAIVWEGVFSRWNNRRAGVAPDQTYGDDLAIAMRRQPQLRVMLMTGYYDLLATPLATASSARAAGLPPERVTLHSYASGHMSYLGETAPQFGRDVRQFILDTLASHSSAAATPLPASPIRNDQPRTDRDHSK